MTVSLKAGGSAYHETQDGKPTGVVTINSQPHDGQGAGVIRIAAEDRLALATYLLQPDNQSDAFVQARERFFTASEHDDVVKLRSLIVALGQAIIETVPDGRNKSLALTALEDVQMRGNRGIFATGTSK